MELLKIKKENSLGSRKKKLPLDSENLALTKSKTQITLQNQKDQALTKSETQNF